MTSNDLVKPAGFDGALLPVAASRLVFGIGNHRFANWPVALEAGYSASTIDHSSGEPSMR